VGHYLEGAVWAEGGEDGGEDDDEDGADDVFADADDAVFAGVAVFHTHRIAPWRIPVNTHRTDVGNTTPWIRRSKNPCAADSAAVDRRTPRNPLSSGRFAADSTHASGTGLPAPDRVVS
jgi:hypothetical protein